MVKKSSSAGTAQSISVLGNANGLNQVAGNNNTVTATGRLSTGTPLDVLQALAAIQAALSTHPATKALTDAAVQQANTDKPDKAAIGSQLKAALEVAKTTLGWAELASKLAPSIQTTVAWLGGSWAGILNI